MPNGAVICQEQASWCSDLSGTGLMVQWSVRNRLHGAVLCQEQAWWYSDLSGTGLMVQWSVRNRPDGTVICQEQAWWCSALSGTGLMVQCSVRNRPDGAVLCQEQAWWCSALSGTGLMVQHSRLPMVLNKLAKTWDNFIQSVNLCWRRNWWQQPPVTHCSQFQADNHIQQWVNSEGCNRCFITSASFCCVLSISLYNLSKFLLCTFYQSL